MSYSDSVDYLYSLQKYGIKFGLDNTVRLLSAFGNPQNSFKSVHVAGTNGKGSTSAMTASILQAAGFKAGLFTSPHLVSFTERIRINNEEIKEREVVELTAKIRDVVSRMEDFSPTFFEFVTVMGFLYFKRRGVDWAVIETGMGGRLDATNVLVPEASVITGISLDHREFLGGTLKQIAGEKAGIIKNGIPVVTALQENEVMDVINKKAAEKDSAVYAYGKDFSALIRSEDINGSVFDYRGEQDIPGIRINLAGSHQVFNASLAVKTSEILMKQSSGQASGYIIKSGIEKTQWPGRLEFISYNPDILIDGAHNPSASAVLADTLRKHFINRYQRLILILGVMADKDIKGILKPLLPLASGIIFTAPSYSRSAPPEALARYASEMGFPDSHIAGSVRDAIETAKKSCASGLPDFRALSLVVITGSFYTTGEAKEILRGEGVLSRLRE